VGEMITFGRFPSSWCRFSATLRKDAYVRFWQPASRNC